MSEQLPTGPENAEVPEALPPWVQELRARQQEEAARWAGHQLGEDGFHDEEECYQCLLGKEVKSNCRCGLCCRRLLIETTVEDAEREPKIREKGSPLKGFDDELVGYLLNGREDMACVFLDQPTNRCTIYETRPLLCRLFDCDGAGREQLIELGIIDRGG